MLSSLLKRPGRSIMTILAVSVAAALLMSMFSVTEGMSEHNRSWIRSGGEDIVIAGEGIRGGLFGAHELVLELENDTGNISSAAPALVSFLDLGYEGERYSVLCIGIIPSRTERFLNEERKIEISGVEMTFDEWFPTQGDPFYGNGSYGGPFTGEALVSENMVEKVRGLAGGEFSLGTSGDAGDRFTVNGIFSTPITGEGLFGLYLSGIVLIHLGELQPLVSGEDGGAEGVAHDRASTIAVSIRDEKRTSGEIEDIAQGLRRRYPLFTVLTRNDRLARSEERRQIADIFYAAAGSVTLVIGLLFVACIMVINVHERRKEIGIMRAIGISKNTLFRQVFLSALVLIGVGALLAIPLGYFGSEYLSEFIGGEYGLDRQMTSFSVSLVARSLLYVMTVGCVFALYPALRATRVEVIEAMRAP